MTGPQLREVREAKRVRVTELAAVLKNRHGETGVTHSWVSQLEARSRITRVAERRYLEALATFDNVEDAAA